MPESLLCSSDNILTIKKQKGEVFDSSNLLKEEEKNKLLDSSTNIAAKPAIHTSRSKSLVSPRRVAPATTSTATSSEDEESNRACTACCSSRYYPKKEKRLPNGDLYIGTFSAKSPHGSGKYLWSDGCMYEGDWKNGKASGKGKFSWPSGATFEGKFKAGKMDGIGTFIGQDGDMYKGDWLSDRKHGYGVKHYSNGDYYEGYWKKNLQDGQGRYVWKNGNEYIGEWRNGVINGRGVLIWPNRNRFDGNWENGVIIGQGVFTWPNGSCYIGSWTKDDQNQMKQIPNGTYYPPLKGEVFRGSISTKLSDSLKIDENVGVNEKGSFNFPRICIWESDREAGDITCEILDDVEASMFYKNKSVGRDGIKQFRRNPCFCAAANEAKKPGQTISKGHKHYDLMLNLQLGIRHSVGKDASKIRELKASDFDPKEKFWTRFSPQGSKNTSPHHSLEFRWKDYCPMVFRHLRKLFVVDQGDYMLAICGNDALRELSSPGKSGCFFYLTQDDRFIIKTVKKSEVKVLVKMLPSYYDHVRRYENSLVRKFYGVHCVKPIGGVKGVPPLDVAELLAHLVCQSSPFLDQLGIKKDVSEKIVESLCSKRRNQLHAFPGGESSVVDANNVYDELDLRIASVFQSTGHSYEDGFWGDSKKQDISDGRRHVAIVTTASLPWMTGTAVNPLFRAAYLSKSAEQTVTLLVPWLCRSDQELVYPNNLTFSSPEEQELYIRNWLEERVGFKADFQISFYPGKFSKSRRSILPAGDTTQFIKSKNADIAILEEPEHLNWYHHGKRWTDKFNHVIGIVHTNYLEYIKREKNGAIQAFLVKHINNWVTRAYCHKVLRLSAATQDMPKSVICNVHGVNPKFLEIGEKVAAERQLGEQSFSKGAYFLGKMVWAKGYKELIDILAKHKRDLDGFKLDVFGNGEDAHEVQNTAQRLNLNVNFMKGRDHADDSLHGYKVFINPSVSDVLCTATAEALAMGKFVVCADHPSNEFFRAFPNCLTYKNPEDFVTKVKEAMANEPRPLTREQMYSLSWEAATQRFMEYSELSKVLNSEAEVNNRKGMRKSVSMPSLTSVVDGGLAFAHYCLTGSEFLRLCTGAIPGTRDYDKQHCKDLDILPPHVENPIYGW